MARPERLEGRDGAIWAAYVGGATQEAIAVEHGISRQRVGQVLGEVRETVGESARMDAALLAKERADALLKAVWPEAMAGDPKAVGAALRVLERLARALGTDAAEPLRVSLERRLDDDAELVTDALEAALSVLDLGEERRQLAVEAAQARLLGEPPPDLVPAAEVEPVADEDIDVDALLREVDDGREDGDG